MTMPWMALVCDISGVWSVAGTFEMTEKPTNAASTKIVSSVTTLMRPTGTCWFRDLRRSSSSRPLSLDLAVVRDAGAGHDFVIEVQIELSVLAHQEAQEVFDVLRV